MRDKCPIFPDYKKRKEKKFTGILVSLKIQSSTFSISYIMGDPSTNPCSYEGNIHQVPATKDKQLFDLDQFLVRHRFYTFKMITDNFSIVPNISK